MKNLIFILTLALTTLQTISAQENFTLTINFTGIKSDAGKLYVAAYSK